MKNPRKNSRRTSWKNSRRLMFAASSVWVAVLLVVLVFRGGGTATVEPNLARPSPSFTQQADELAALGEYAAAAVKYRSALEQEPDDISLRFALGAVLSHVGRQDETAEQFRWVVARGDPGSLEVRVARRWLVSAGLLGAPVTFASLKGPEEDQQASGTGSVPLGKVKGRTEWKGTESKGTPRRVRIVLQGVDGANKEAVFDTSVNLGEPYEFDKVPPGDFRLTARRAGTQLWEQRVTVEAGRETVLDLSNANSPSPGSERRGPTQEGK